jgi:hypothetical protein
MVSSLTSPARIQIDNQMETTRVLERFVGAHAGNTARTTVIGRFYRLRCCGGFRQYGPASGCLPEQVKTHPADRQGGSDVQMDLPLCLRMRWLKDRRYLNHCLDLRFVNVSLQH